MSTSIDQPATPLPDLNDEALLALLATLEHQPLSERVRILADVHEQLSAALTDLNHL